MDIDWHDIEYGDIIGHIDEPEKDFYYWVSEGRRTYSGETKEHGAKKREYRKKFYTLINNYFPEYAL
jgi:hypothetical protein